MDDTLIESNATNLVDRIKTMISHSAQSRPVFEGARELYDSFSVNYKNPLWFVSGSSYNLHDLLYELCSYNEIPRAPFLLRDLGLNDSKWIKKDTSPYKMEHIRHILDMYPNLKFILFGDSGQKDPEIYRNVLSEYPDRVLAIYIRHVADDQRKKEIRALKDGCTIPFKLIRESNEAISHARKNGLLL